MATPGDHAGTLAVLAALCAGCLDAPAPAPRCGTDDGLAQISLGRDHACARLDNGGVWCWGKNDQGQIGDASLIDSSTPVQVAGLADVVEVSAGQDHSCARLDDGGVRCWGSGADGQLGDGSSPDTQPDPVPVEGLPPASALAIGDDFSCALDRDGGVWCWGENQDGQLGDGSVTSRSTPEPIHWPAGAGRALQIGVGQKYGCAVTDTGRVLCWGSNELGQLGDGTQVDHHEATGTAELGVAVALVVGGFHACAIDELGGTWCWGDTARGQIGRVTDNPGDNCESPDGPMSCLPVPVELPAPAQLLSAGKEHTCAAVVGGDVLCWGANDEGQLGHGTFDATATPTRLSVAVPPPVALESGETQTCSVGADDDVYCWGGNHTGQLGQTPLLTSPLPARVDNAGHGTLITAGDDHTCVHDGARVQCWGRNDDGELGDGSEQGSSTPVVVDADLSFAATLGRGSDHTCAIVDGRVWCWGGNEDGQSVRDGAEDVLSPADSGIDVASAIDVSGGDEHTCAVGADQIVCWGGDELGQLGDGDDVSGDPVTISLASPEAVTAGDEHTCAIAAGAVLCWGDNSAGQLGNGSTQPDKAPGTPLDLGAQVLEVEAGGLFTCALAGDGTIWCWGDNAFGQLGNGTTAMSATPTQVIDLPGLALRLFVGKEHACAIVEGAMPAVVCWGRNSSGQLGDGSYQSSSVPVLVDLPGPIPAMALGTQHSCALVADGSDELPAVYCWGSDVDGKLASARPLQFPTAVPAPTVCR